MPAVLLVLISMQIYAHDRWDATYVDKLGSCSIQRRNYHNYDLRSWSDNDTDQTWHHNYDPAIQSHRSHMLHSTDETILSNTSKSANRHHRHHHHDYYIHDLLLFKWHNLNIIVAGNFAYFADIMQHKVLSRDDVEMSTILNQQQPAVTDWSVDVHCHNQICAYSIWQHDVVQWVSRRERGVAGFKMIIEPWHLAPFSSVQRFVIPMVYAVMTA